MPTMAAATTMAATAVETATTVEAATTAREALGRDERHAHSGRGDKCDQYFP